MGVRWGSIVGAVGAACFTVGDVLLLAAEEDPKRFPVLRRSDVDIKVGAMLPFSSERLLAGALTGVVGAPLMTLGALDQMRGASGRGGAVAPVLLWLGVAPHPAAAYIHGMFYPYAEAFKKASDAYDSGAGPKEVTALVRKGLSMAKAIEVPYAVYGLAVATASVLESARIARGESVYPRWSFVLVPPLVPVAAATWLTASHVIRHPAARALQGAGISLGMATSFLAGALLARR